MVLQLAPDYYNSSIYRSLFQALDDRGVVNQVYVADNVNVAALSENDKNIIVASKAFSPVERLLFFPKQRFIQRHLEASVPIDKINIIHAHTLFSSGYAAYQLWKKYNIPYIVAVRNTDVNTFFRYIKHLMPIGWQVLANASKVIFISHAYKQTVLNHYVPKKLRKNVEEKSIVIPNGIHPVFLDDALPHACDQTTIRLIYVGKLMRLKNINTLIRVCDNLSSLGHKVRLTLVGKIVEKEYVDIADNRPYIRYVSPTPPVGVRDIMRQNDIFIMPSYWETFGLVYAEAMSQGLPVIYTRGQGFDGWFAEGEVGYAVSSKNVKEITKRILDIYTDYPAISTRCQQNALLFDWQKIADTYTDIYNSLKIE